MAAARSLPVASTLSVRTYRGCYEAHSHAHAQVLVGVQGSLQLEVDGRCAFVDPSCGLVIPAGSGHGYLAESPVRVLVLDCDAARATDRLRRFALPSTWPTDAASLSADRLLADLVGAPNLQPRRRLDLFPRGRGRLHRRQQGNSGTAQLLAEPRLPPERRRPVQSC